MSVEIESEDVVRLILQFFKENNLNASVAALQEETSVTLNTVENRDTFIKDITEGKWAQVLEQIVHLDLAPRKLVDLYEQVIIELCEMRELSAARTLLRQTEPMDILKQSQPERYLRLEHLLSRSFFEAKEVYTDGMTKEKRRQVIAQALATEVDVVEPSRLMTLLGDSAKWQQHQGILRDGARFDPFSSSSAMQKGDEDAVASDLYCIIKFPGKGTYAESAIFSPNGQLLVTGSVDGFIEIWNHSNGKLRKDLKYQAEDNLMAMDESVISMAFSRDSELLVSGSTDGKIAVWKVQNGLCQRRFSPAHSQGVTSLCFNKDATLVLSGSYDKLVKIHNIKSGKLVKEFQGHTSFINAVLYSQDNKTIISGSSDGTIKIWDVSLGTCVHSLTLDATKTCPVQGLVYIPKTLDQVVVSSKSKTVSIVSMMDGKIIDTMTMDGSVDILSSAVSPQGELVYIISEDSTLHCIRRSTGKLENKFKVCDNEVIGLASHPFSNIVAIYDDAGHVYLYKHL